jgi:hypothetical protein
VVVRRARRRRRTARTVAGAAVAAAAAAAAADVVAAVVAEEYAIDLQHQRRRRRWHADNWQFTLVIKAGGAKRAEFIAPAVGIEGAAVAAATVVGGGGGGGDARSPRVRPLVINRRAHHFGGELIDCHHHCCLVVAHVKVVVASGVVARRVVVRRQWQIGRSAERLLCRGARTTVGRIRRRHSFVVARLNWPGVFNSLVATISSLFVLRSCSVRCWRACGQICGEDLHHVGSLNRTLWSLCDNIDDGQ